MYVFQNLKLCICDLARQCVNTYPQKKKGNMIVYRKSSSLNILLSKIFVVVICAYVSLIHQTVE